MNRIVIILVSILFGLHLQAQNPVTVAAPQSPNPQPQASTLRFGFLSYDSMLVAMPDYTLVQRQMETLRNAYNDELQRVEDEFNKKYEDFLDGQRDFPRTILLKRQTELQELLQRNIDFKRQGLADLQQAERDAMAPLQERLRQVIALVATQKQLAFVINTDANACPFIDPAFGTDISEEVKKALRK